MISKNDLYDISAAFIQIRKNIRCNENVLVISAIRQVLTNTFDYTEDNQIRKALSTIERLDKIRWQYVYHNNYYVNYQFLKNKYTYDLLSSICFLLENLLIQNNFEQAEDLVDCVHCLPNILADNHFTIPKSFWKTHVKTYRKKWDKTFLRSEERDYRRSWTAI